MVVKRKEFLETFGKYMNEEFIPKKLKKALPEEGLEVNMLEQSFDLILKHWVEVKSTL